MSNKERIFRNTLNKKFHNNQDLYTCDNNKSISLDNKLIRNKIDEILADKSFIYRIKVHIVIDNKIIERKIIGIYNDNLVTIDNEYIPINNIMDIYK